MRLDKGEIHAFCFLDEGHSNVVFPHVLLQASVFLYCRAGGCTPDVEADEVEDRVCGCRAFSWVSFGGVESYLCPSSSAFAAASWLSLAASDPFDPVGLGSPWGPVSCVVRGPEGCRGGQRPAFVVSTWKMNYVHVCPSRCIGVWRMALIFGGGAVAVRRGAGGQGADRGGGARRLKKVTGATAAVAAVPVPAAVSNSTNARWSHCEHMGTA